MKTFTQYLIAEQQVLTQVRLTTNQKRAISILLSKDDNKAHDDEIKSDRNMSGAVDVLLKLGLVAHSHDDFIEITDKGISIADQEGLSDGGTLTDVGQQYATATTGTSPSGAPSVAPARGEEGDAPQPFAQAAGDVGMSGTSESLQRIGKLLSE